MTREEAKEVLDDMKVKIDIPKSAVTQHKRNEALDMAISALSENKGEWIPVSERLPDETKTRGHGLCNLLVTHKYAGITRTHQAVFDQGKFLKLETYREDNTVIAWMPLPDPYKKGE